MPLDDPSTIDATSAHLTGAKLALTIFALCTAVFCVALDNTIIATAIPRITDDFHALQDVGWYGSAYLLTTCAFQLPFGKLYGLFNPKWVFMAALAFFEVGSLICGAAPNSTALIIGRAIQGIGAAGIFNGGMVIIAHVSPLEKRPVYNSFMGGMFGIASVVGPLLGGAFTDKVTWRLCFYINLPLGAMTAIVLLFFLHLPPVGNPFKKQTVSQILWSLDPIGLMLFMAAIICLLIALQWGGGEYAWRSGQIITLFVVFGLSIIAFVGVQAWLGEGATIPPRIGMQRTIWSSSLFIFCLFSTFFLLIYFLPIYFQAVKGMSAISSGVASIPLILCNVFAIIIGGVLISKFGHYMPLVFASVIISSIGAGLMTTLQPNTGAGKWIGFQILYGFGVGCALSIPQVAAQTVLSLKDIPTGLAVVGFFQNFGPAVLLSAGNNVLNERLLEYVSALDIEEIDTVAVVKAGATAIRKVVPAEHLGRVVVAYNEALKRTFEVALIMSCLSLVGGVFMEWKSVHTPGKTGGEEGRAVEEGEE
ncbi:MFS general substrate transporter [Melanomma pulvis-pyrius CBS 109.77]|uniref:MFS general substrate transporter n=1 Tax=Melanomma pulvis-pyrius CBS 109.77 TaxID=1314802 RepID=A0A6A6WZG7_9PLEO|nr:MFS general substrate transporter [Melanomma pulvis-pyrius CBS 109.77]